MTMIDLCFALYSLNLVMRCVLLRKSRKAKADMRNALNFGKSKKAVCGNRRQVIVDYGCLLSTNFIINKKLYKVN